MRGPTTTPAIQVLLFADKLEGGVWSVDCGAFELDEALLVEVVAILVDIGTVLVATVNV
jgi:hypothetical protein